MYRGQMTEDLEQAFQEREVRNLEGHLIYLMNEERVESNRTAIGYVHCITPSQTSDNNLVLRSWTTGQKQR